MRPPDIHVEMTFDEYAGVLFTQPADVADQVREWVRVVMREVRHLAVTDSPDDEWTTMTWVATDQHLHGGPPHDPVEVTVRDGHGHAVCVEVPPPPLPARLLEVLAAR